MATRSILTLTARALPLALACGVLAGLSRQASPAEPTAAPQGPGVGASARPVGFPPPPAVLLTGGAAPSVANPVVPAAPVQAPMPLAAELPDPQPEPKQPAAEPPAAPRAFPAPPADPLAPDRRLPGLAAPVGSTPKPTPEVKARFDKYVDQVVDPQNTLDLVVNRDRLVRLKEVPTRVQLTDDTVARMLTVTPREISLTGRRVGTTVLTLWFGDPKDPARQEVLSYLVRVLPDPEYKERLERVYEVLAAEINRAFPDSVVKLQLVGDKLVVSGQAKDIYEGFQILRVVRANDPQQAPAATIPVGQVNVTVPPDAVTGVPNQAGEQGLANFLVAGGPNVVNLLRVGGEHQVMLKVTVAEVNRAAARSVGVNFAVARQDGLVVFSNQTGGLAGGGTGGIGGGTGGLAGGTGAVQVAQLTNLTFLLGGGQVAAAVNALRSLNLARSLAEPTLTTLNGRPAQFQAGGQFPVPVVTGFTAAGLQGVQFVPFGVQLQFTPVITDDDRVRLQVNAEVSTRDLSTGQTNINGAGVPSLSNRSFSTTVELRAGETLAVAGLVQNNLGSDATRVPFFGDLPVIGRLFAFDRTSHAEQELVVLITPYLVHPLGKGECKPPLPGSDLAPPTDCEFYLLGRLQNYAAAGIGPTHGPADPALLRRRQACERQLLIGPVGYADGK